MLRRLDGSLCPTPCSISQRWRQHFTSLEAGRDVTADDLLALVTGPRDAWPLPPSISDVPTPSCLASALKAAPLGKATGADGIPNGLGVACPVETAACLQPLALKLCLRGSEPVGYKAGFLCKMYKGRGPRDVCTSFRGILLLPCHAKILHKALRPAIAQHYEHTALPFQLGGRKGMTTTFASHAVRGFVRGQLLQGRSVAILYADIAAAYYASVRELTAASSDKLDFDAVCSGLKLDPADLASLRAHIATGSALDLDGADPWLQGLTSELNSHTWMTISNDDGGPILTQRGSRPGSSWADVVFALLMRRVLARRDALIPGRAEPQLLWDGARSFDAVNPAQAAQHATLGFSDLVWADDLATPVVSEEAQALLSKVAVEAGALADALSEHALELSFGPLKTAAVLAMRGAGSRLAKVQAFGRHPQQAESSVDVLREHYAPSKLPLVSAYRHLGSVQSFDGSLRQEVLQRVGQAWGAFREGRRKLYKNKLVHQARRCELLCSLTISKLFVGAGAWPPLRKGEHRAIRSAFYGLCRATLCVPRAADQHLYACTIRSKLAVNSPTALLHAARLRYAAQMIKHAPPHLWAITKGDRPFCTQMLASFEWLFRHVERTCGLPNPRDGWGAWAEVMTHTPGKFKGWIKRSLALELVVDGVASAHAELYKLCRSRASDPEASHRDGEWGSATEVCIPCRKSFPSRLAWAGHAARVHGYRTPATQTARGTVCQGCGKAFANPHRLRRHVAYSEQCRLLWGRFVPYDTAAQAHPQLPPQLVPGIIDVDAAPCGALSAAEALLGQLLGLATPTVSDALEAVSHCVQPISTLRATVADWRDRLFEGTAARDVADRVLLLMQPGILSDSAPAHGGEVGLDDGDFPASAPLSPFSLADSGDHIVLQIPKPPCSEPVWPWTCYGTLRAARAHGAWACEALAVCSQAVQASAHARVALLAEPAAHSALQQALVWLVQGGFWFDGALCWRSFCFTSNS